MSLTDVTNYFDRNSKKLEPGGRCQKIERRKPE